MSKKCQIQVKFAETVQEFDEIKVLRIQVFVAEQGVPFEQEFDEYDDFGFHAMAIINESLVGTGRVYRISSREIYIGRMAVKRCRRRNGIGGMLLGVLEEKAIELGGSKVTLHAQVYVRKFYEKHGYIVRGEPFLEENIDHIMMVKEL